MSRQATMFDLEGRRVGRTYEAAELFLATLAEVIDEGRPVYVTAAPDTPPEFVERLRRFCPVVVDSAMPAGQMDIIQEP